MPEHGATQKSVAGARWRVNADELSLRLDPAELGFQTTADVSPLDTPLGQERALAALELGLSIRKKGYNIYVSGMIGSGRKQLVQQLVKERASKEPTPPDWVYLHNFQEPDRPLAMRLSSGHGMRLKEGLETLLQRMSQDLPAALKAKDFDAEKERLSGTYSKRSEEIFDRLVEKARTLNLVIRRMPNGVLLFVPLKDGKPMEPADVEKLTPDERADLDRRHEELGEHATVSMTEQQELARELQAEIEEMIRVLARRLLDPMIDRLKADQPIIQLAGWLDSMRDHLLHHLDRLKDKGGPSMDLPPELRAGVRPQDPFLEYRVNVVADHSHVNGAPVVVEICPTYKNLFGAIEHDVNLFGRITTDFTRIKPGSLLRANGGYLVLDLEDALTEPLVWKQLKRTLKSEQLLTEVYEPFSLLTTVGLKPEPIPIDVKLVVIGSPDLFYMLQYYDDDFRDLFKIRADFGPDTPRTPEGHQAYARFIAQTASAEGLLPFDAGAVVETIRFGARQAGHRQKLTVELGYLADLLREADHWARKASAKTVSAEHVRHALENRIYRSDRIAERVREMIAEGTLKVSVEGCKIGQINGLAVWDLGDYAFGRPSRVTASVGIGQEGVINIEREAELSGSAHDKGVMILEGYLRNQYGAEHPLTLSASLAFEQSYGWIEGDSASSAELYCLLSAIANVPLRQDIAVTGSVNQHGEVQAVGAVNEKIEGFFDICQQVGLSNTQGVCIPRANTRHLELRPDIVDAVRNQQFHVWAIDTIDEGIELLTDLKPGDVTTADAFHFVLDQRLRKILSALEEQPGTNAIVRTRTPSTGPHAPTPPPLPGEED
ncbi:MAG TPA: AAA family ATPase [Gemmataceae bacterium]|nr:AAA family ATPase [Gemmataceae bacterium]